MKWNLPFRVTDGSFIFHPDDIYTSAVYLSTCLLDTHVQVGAGWSYAVSPGVSLKSVSSHLLSSAVSVVFTNMVLSLEPVLIPSSSTSFSEDIPYGWILSQPRYRGEGLGPAPNDVTDLMIPCGNNHPL